MYTGTIQAAIVPVTPVFAFLVGTSVHVPPCGHFLLQISAHVKGKWSHPTSIPTIVLSAVPVKLKNLTLNEKK